MPVNVSVSAQAQKAYLATTTPTSTTGGYAVTTNNGSFSIAPPTTGDYTNMSIQFATESTVAAATPKANYDATNKMLTISVNSTTATTWTALQSALANTTVTTTSGGVVTKAASTVDFALSGATTGAKFDPLKDATPVSTATLVGVAAGVPTSLGLMFTKNSSAATQKDLSYTINVSAGGGSDTNVVYGSDGNATINIDSTQVQTAQQLLDKINNALGGTLTASITSGSATDGISLLGLTTGASGKVATSSTVNAAAAQGVLRLTGNGIVQLTAKTGGLAGNISVDLIAATGTTTSATMADATHMVVSVGTAENTTEHVAAAITRDTDYTATSVNLGTVVANDLTNQANQAIDLEIGTPGNAVITFTARRAGQLAAARPQVQVIDDSGTAGSKTNVSVNAAGNLILSVGADNATVTVNDLANMVNHAVGGTATAAATTGGALYLSAVVGGGGVLAHAMAVLGNDGTPAVTTTAKTTLAGGADALKQYTTSLSAGGTALTEEIQFMATGSQGSHLFDFKAGTLLSEVSSGVNSWADGTGITSRLATSGAQTQLIFESSDFGSNAKVGLDVREGKGQNFKDNMVDRNGNNIMNSAGTDIEAKVNGVVATGDGNTLSIDTPALSMQMTVNAPTTADPTPANIQFTITGGGAHFQIGPNVVSTQKAVIGIQSVDTANMNTIYGYLDQLHSGQNADLSSDNNMTLGGKIITAVAGKIATLRGRLGAFSKTTMETNIQTLSSTVNSLTNAQSQIQDADFAAETAALTRAQVLTQSGTSVLSIANRGPQNVLALLQNL
jgi:flagellin